MLKITLQNIGRRFNRDWIFRKIDYQFEQGQSYAILGANGSGKSTLLQVIAGSLTPSEGYLAYREDEKEIDINQAFQHLSMAAPYLELIEEFSLIELIDFHFQFKKPINALKKEYILELLGMESSKNKSLRFFSSGMKQRVKLALAICSAMPVVLLDEPTSNLDEQGIKWYHNLIEKYTSNRLVIVCSNQNHEYGFCQHHIHLTDYK